MHPPEDLNFTWWATGTSDLVPVPCARNGSRTTRPCRFIWLLTPASGAFRVLSVDADSPRSRLRSSTKPLSTPSMGVEFMSVIFVDRDSTNGPFVMRTFAAIKASSLMVAPCATGLFPSLVICGTTWRRDIRWSANVILGHRPDDCRSQWSSDRVIWKMLKWHQILQPLGNCNEIDKKLQKC